MKLSELKKILDEYPGIKNISAKAALEIVKGGQNENLFKKNKIRKF